MGPVRRRFAKSIAALTFDPAKVLEAEIVFGELVGNAFRHGYPAPVEVALTVSTTGIKLAVTNLGPPFAFNRDQPKPDEVRGRGFPIVAALAADVQVTRTASFSTITVTL